MNLDRVRPVWTRIMVMFRRPIPPLPTKIGDDLEGVEARQERLLRRYPFLRRRVEGVDGGGPSPIS